jgi:hypothetical protein
LELALSVNCPHVYCLLLALQAAADANQPTPKQYVVDLAPGSSVALGNQNGYPRIAAQAPGTGVVVAQVRSLPHHYILQRFLVQTYCFGPMRWLSKSL